METIKVVVTDDSELREIVAELSELNVRLHGNVEASSLHRFFDSPLDFFEVENGPAVGAGELGVRIKRAQRLNNLLSALRALDVNSGHAADATTTLIR